MYYILNIYYVYAPVRKHRMKRNTTQLERPFTPAAQQFEKKQLV